MHEFAADRRDNGLPAFGADKFGNLLAALFLGPFPAIADQHPARFDDVEITAFEMPSGRELPDRHAVLLVELDDRCVVRPAALELHMTDKRAPGRHGGTVAGKEIPVQNLVGLEVMTGDAVLFVDRYHLGMLFHGQLQIKPMTGLVGIGQRPANQRPRLDPAEILGLAQKHVIQLGVIIGDAPTGRRFHLVFHGQSPGIG